MRTEVKICGLKTPSALNAALDAGADYVGLVFYSRSPRHVDPETAAGLAAAARGRAKVVALIVDESDAAIERIARTVKPDYFQAHGKESVERVRAISAATGIPIIKAVKIASEADVAAARDYERAAELVLFDAKAADEGAALPGGNGVAFDWTFIKRGGGSCTPRLHAVGRPHARERRRGDRNDRGADRRCVVGRRIGAWNQGPAAHPEFH